MSAKLVFILAGALVLAGCNSSDPTVFPYSKDQVQSMLVDAKTTLPRRDGPGEMIKIWGAGRSSKGVKLNMKYASWAPLLECEAIITSITPTDGVREKWMCTTRDVCTPVTAGPIGRDQYFFPAGPFG